MSLPPLVEPAEALTVDEVRRYSRHLIIPDVGMTGQKRLKNAKVLVVGAAASARPPCCTWPRPASARSASSTSTWWTSPTCNARSSTASPTSAAEGRIGPGQHPRDQPAGQRGAARGPAGLRQRPGDLRRLRPDRRRHRQLRHQVPGQRRLRAARQAVRVGLDLPLRRTGQRVLGRVRPVLPVPVPRAAAARHGAVLRRGRGPRRAVRLDRVDPGQRGDQAHHRDRRAAGRA